MYCTVLSNSKKDIHVSNIILHKLFAKITVAMEFAKKVEKFVKPNYKKKTTFEAKHYSFPKVHSILDFIPLCIKYDTLK